MIQWNLDLTKCQGTGEIKYILFVISRGPYIQQLHLTNVRENYQNVHYTEVKLIINLQNLPFLDLKH